jgi:branched-chain amino acid transport system permease protein
VVTIGIRSITAAALAGVAFALLPGVFQTYVPARWGAVPAILFGLGAVAVARHPEGAVVQNGRQLRQLLARLGGRGERPAPSGAASSGAVPSDSAPSGAPATDAARADGWAGSAGTAVADAGVAAGRPSAQPRAAP